MVFKSALRFQHIECVLQSIIQHFVTAPVRQTHAVEAGAVGSILTIREDLGAMCQTDVLMLDLHPITQLPGCTGQVALA